MSASEQAGQANLVIAPFSVFESLALLESGAVGKSCGSVRMDGYDISAGALIHNCPVSLNRRRQLNAPPQDCALNFATGLWMRSDLMSQSDHPDVLKSLIPVPCFPAYFAKQARLQAAIDEFISTRTADWIERPPDSFL